MDMLLPSCIECEYEKKTPLLYMQYTHRGMKPYNTYYEVNFCLKIHIDIYMSIYGKSFSASWLFFLHSMKHGS